MVNVRNGVVVEDLAVPFKEAEIPNDDEEEKGKEPEDGRQGTITAAESTKEE